MFNRFCNSKPKKEDNTKALVFRFWDGEKQRGVDPLRLGFRLGERVDAEFMVCAHKAQMDNDPASAMKLIDTFREVLEVESYHEIDGVGKGLTDIQVMNVYGDFIEFQNQVKKKTESFATSLQPMEQASSGLTEKLNTLFGSTSPEPISDNPSP